MSRQIVRVTVASLLLFCSACQTIPNADLAVVDRSVWTGDGFERHDIFVIDGMIRDRAKVGKGTITLGGNGRFVVPGYADAHQHRTSANTDSSDAYLAQGTYYLWNPNSLSRFATSQARAFFERPDTVDIANAYGGLTEPGSHPEPLYRDTLSKYIYTDIDPDDFAGDAFYHTRSEEEAIANIERLAEIGASFVKIYLLESENFQEGGSTDTGLDPSCCRS